MPETEMAPLLLLVYEILWRNHRVPIQVKFILLFLFSEKNFHIIGSGRRRFQKLDLANKWRMSHTAQSLQWLSLEYSDVVNNSVLNYTELILPIAVQSSNPQL